MAAGISIFNKASFFCKLGAGGHGLQASSSIHDDLEDAGLQLGGRLVLNLQQGSPEASPGSGIIELIHANGFSAVVNFCRHGGGITISSGEALLRSGHGVLEPFLPRSDSFLVAKRTTVATSHRRKRAPEQLALAPQW
jgi:hypothetical protein